VSHHPDGVTNKSAAGAKRGAVAVLGNMKVGKTTLFDRMCSGKTELVSVPGIRVQVNTGRIKSSGRQVLDAPGIYSVFSASVDARVSRNILLPLKRDWGVEGIVLVADVKNMKRSISLALQYAEFGLPMLMVVNMIDEAAPRGIEIDFETLSQLLGIGVCTTVAREGIGVSRMVTMLQEMHTPEIEIEYPAVIKPFLEIVERLLSTEEISPRLIGTLLLLEDRCMENYIERRFGIGMLDQLKDLAQAYRNSDPQPCNVLLMGVYNKKAQQITDRVQRVEAPLRSPFLAKFGDWCTQFSTGIPIAALVLYSMYLFVGSFGATFLVDTINHTLFEGFLIPLTKRIVSPIPSEFIRAMMVDPDFGILPTGVFLALGLVLPVLFCFYIAFGVLEDSGYLPRISILLNRLLQFMGLNGKGVIPLVMGFSCVTMAILTTRMLDTRKEKNIATFLLLLGMPCAPLLAVMFIILGKMPVSASLTVFGIIFLQIFLAGVLANRILPGRPEPLFMEIPAMRLPKPIQVLKMATSKTYFFMKEAVPVFVLASLFVFLFERIGGLTILEQIFEPVISGFMGLPEKSVQVFLKTLIRRESGATEIEHLSIIYDNVQLVVNLLVMTFLSPCMNATIVLFKERGTRAASLIMVSVMVYAVVIGAVVNHTCRLLGITFT
jgi:ferrous iron transport protein B